MIAHAMGAEFGCEARGKAIPIVSSEQEIASSEIKSYRFLFPSRNDVI
jgi:hypothetical protein